MEQRPKGEQIKLMTGDTIEPNVERGRRRAQESNENLLKHFSESSTLAQAAVAVAVAKLAQAELLSEATRETFRL